MLRQGLNLVKLLRGQAYNKALHRQSISAFCNEPLKGFEKYDRKKSNTEQLAKKDKESAQEIKQDEKKDEDVEDKEVPKKKYNFTFDSKLFKNDKKDESKDKPDPEEKKDDNEEDHHHKKNDKKFDFKDFKFNPQDPQQRKVMVALFSLLGVSLAVSQIEWDQTISYTDFMRNYLDKDVVKRIVIDRGGTNQKVTATIFTHDNQSAKIVLGNVDHFLENLERVQIEKGRSKEQFIPVEFQHSMDTNKAIDRSINLVYLGVSLTIAYTLFKSMRQSMGSAGKGGGGGDMFGFGKSNVKQFGFEQQIKVKFKDVAGLDEAKHEIREFVDFLKKPRKYKEIGAKIPRGALLSGPPGTGKTMLAKACAGEAGVPFFYVSGSDFVEMFVGVGASRVRDLFKQAKAKSPSIIFIDEIDAVGRKREGRVGGNDERDNTLNQLLVEMDGFGTDHNVIVLAATNRKELLDAALTRPGRFDRTVDITLPDIEGRMQIFLVHLQPLKLDVTKSMEEYARRLSTLTPGFSGAEISNLCNEAAILAARKNKTTVDAHDFEMATERVMAGLEKKSIISEEERKIVAYHESGHAVVSWFLAGGMPLLKLTIIPRSKGSLGYAQYLPNESQLETYEELLDRICCILGGRCSEQHFFGRITTGAYDDLKKAYELAHAIVTKFGMSEAIGYVGYQDGEFQKSYSDSTHKLIDDEIKSIIDKCTQKVHQLIKDHHEDIDNLSKALLEKETLDLQKIVNILGERPFAPKSNYKAYLDIKRIEQIEKEQEQQEDNVPIAELKQESQ